MKPFNLEEALAGKRVVQRDGNSVASVSKNSDDPDYPLTVRLGKDDNYLVEFYTLDGKFFSEDRESTFDLFMADGDD